MHTFIIAATSIDGFIAEKTDQVSTDWTSKADKQFFRDRTKQAGVMVMGRKTFETIGRPLPGRVNIVLSSSLQAGASKFEVQDLQQVIAESTTRESAEKPCTDSVVYRTSLSPEDLVRELDKLGYSELAVCGGASVYRQFLEAGVVDCFYLTIESVIFGSGVKLFGDGALESKNMVLTEVEKLGEDGTVLLTYTSSREK